MAVKIALSSASFDEYCYTVKVHRRVKLWCTRYAVAIGMLYLLPGKDVEHKSATQQQLNNNSIAWFNKRKKQSLVQVIKYVMLYAV